MNTLIYCEKCNAWKEGGCSLGYPVEPAYFRYCFLTEGHLPAGECPGKTGGPIGFPPDPPQPV